jgi:hypothetical protein
MAAPGTDAVADAVSITALMLYDLVNCPHRVSMDLFADPASRDLASPFVQLLWERGFQRRIARIHPQRADAHAAGDWGDNRPADRRELSLARRGNGVDPDRY